MKRLALAALLLLSTPLALAAPPSDAQVDRLLSVMRVEQTLQAMLPQIEASQRQMVQQIIAGQPMSAEQQQKLDAIIVKSSAHTREILSWQKMQPLYRDIYQQTFSADDMDAMIGFYGSPAGRNLLDKMPQLMQNTMGAVQKLLVPMLQQLQQDIAAEAGASPSVGGAK